MFEAWGRALYRRRRLTLIAALVFAAFAGVWGTGVFSKLSSGNSFTPPDRQSQHEQNLADATFGRNDADVVVLYQSPTLTVADPGYQQAVSRQLSALPAADVAHITTYWGSHDPALVSTNQHETYAVLQLTGGNDEARQKAFKAIKADFGTSSAPGITAQVGGQISTEVAINNEVTANVAKAE